MADSTNIKNIVKEKYGAIARRAAADDCCCTCGCGPAEPASSMVSEKYDGVAGYVAEADLGLGCGLPTQHAGIKEGDTVVDLGSGAGNDVFVARSIVGETGRVVGIDFTQEMIDKANTNNRKMGFDNVEFRLGDIETMPLEDNSADVVVSNCVINLVPDKVGTFAEIHRVLKKGGHFCISDIVLQGTLPDALKRSAEMYTGCVAGALQQEDYLSIIKSTGFTDVKINASKNVDIPDEMLQMFLDEAGVAEFKKSGTGIFSITVSGYKR